jgi:hypothetical protein
MSTKHNQVNLNPDQIRCITVNTDASFCHETSAAGQAFYIVCDVFRCHHASPFSNKPSGPLEAEIMCIGNALHVTLLELIKSKKTLKQLVINTDCIAAIDTIQNKSIPLGISVKNILNQILQVSQCNKYAFRHVKAHSKIDSKRKGANNWCDIAAKKIMREQRALIISAKNGTNIKKS